MCFSSSQCFLFLVKAQSSYFAEKRKVTQSGQVGQDMKSGAHVDRVVPSVFRGVVPAYIHISPQGSEYTEVVS